MDRLRTIAAVVPFVLATAPSVEIRTARAPAGTTGGVVCRVASAAAAPRRVRVVGLDADGAVTFDSGWFALLPEAVFQSGIGAGRTCRFALAEESGELRAEALFFDPQGQRFARRRARSDPAAH